MSPLTLLQASKAKQTWQNRLTEHASATPPPRVKYNRNSFKKYARIFIHVSILADL